jgi:hypothetical protein
MSKTREEAREQLELKGLCSRLVVRSGEETPIEVTLTNQGESVLVVNSRLGMGYPDSTERELYCEIQSQDGEEYLNYHAFRVDYHRKALNEKFYRKLRPGESLRKTLDLQFWYRLREAGTYTVRVVYDPEPYPSQPDAVRGPITAPPITITVHA